MPPLRDRMDDVPLLVEHFLSKYRWRPEAIPTTISEDAMVRLMAHDWPGNVRQLKNLIESMVVLAPEGEIRSRDIPPDVSDRTRRLPMRIDNTREVAGQELEFIFRTLVELKMQIEELRRRIEERPAERVEVIEVGGGNRQIEAATIDPLDPRPEPQVPVIYKPGMTMSEVERAAIDAALRETRGNRRKAAETLGIGERTLYRKLKEYAID